ncbi:MAG: Uncharacterized protein FD133_920 [Erysipelotrichaceae bacterium]|nr:MAG: hypothetical protein FD179_1436 [Erysipelotrichaceae bacterium]TXT18310.1 MAG: Uncharacterized protein FD133_920 [Erysipelotrichaceae bacterium]
MKVILFVKNLNSEEQAEKIRTALEETRVNFSVKPKDHIVVIEGDADAVYTAKVTIRECGFIIE